MTRTDNDGEEVVAVEVMMQTARKCDFFLGRKNFRIEKMCLWGRLLRVESRSTRSQHT